MNIATYPENYRRVGALLLVAWLVVAGRPWCAFTATQISRGGIASSVDHAALHENSCGQQLLESQWQQIFAGQQSVDSSANPLLLGAAMVIAVVLAFMAPYQAAPLARGSPYGRPFYILFRRLRIPPLSERR